MAVEVEDDGGVEVNNIGVVCPTESNCKLWVPLLFVITVMVSPLASVNVIPFWSCDEEPVPV